VNDGLHAGIDTGERMYVEADSMGSGDADDKGSQRNRGTIHEPY
jgi:hypothetical protein